MAIRVHAEYMGRGVLLKKVASQADAESLRNLFAERELAAVISPFAAGDYRVFLAGLSAEEFAKLIEGANIELIQRTTSCAGFSDCLFVCGEKQIPSRIRNTAILFLKTSSSVTLESSGG